MAQFQFGHVAPFPELSFIRLADGWQEIQSEALLLGDSSFDLRILRQFRLSWAPGVMLDFWYRGVPVSMAAGQSFLNLLRQERRLQPGEMESIAEVLAVIGDKSSHNRIDVAATRQLNGKQVLVVKWHNSRAQRRYMSVLFEARGDGRMIREMHFSAPQAGFEENLSSLRQCLDSIQWNQLLPPPLSITA